MPLRDAMQADRAGVAAVPLQPAAKEHARVCVSAGRALSALVCTRPKIDARPLALASRAATAKRTAAAAAAQRGDGTQRQEANTHSAPAAPWAARRRRCCCCYRRRRPRRRRR
eukprot:scaffold3725_cov376-Prasinococcus_capsulatus_cf.AAC.7